MDAILVSPRQVARLEEHLLLLRRILREPAPPVRRRGWLLERCRRRFPCKYKRRGRVTNSAQLSNGYTAGHSGYSYRTLRQFAPLMSLATESR